MSETVWRRSFLAEFAKPQAPDLQFKSLYPRLNRSWEEAKGWPLFKPMHKADAHVLKQLRVPLSDGQSEFEDQVRGLAKLLVEALNEGAISKQLPTKVEGEKGLGKLKRWLEQEGYEHVERDIEYLQRLQRLRSKMSAHRKGSDYEKVLRAESVNDNKVTEVVHLLWSACRMLEGLAEHVGAPTA